ncbi:MAG: aminotransferase class V-fold PLP-dependent enzyme [Chlamydiia bacterium]|nr:aminotransferase class V-fold PLP-dependent enzyme [Chlamydiia bacterium]
MDKKKKIYLDNAAYSMPKTTILRSISSIYKSLYGNPSSTHSYGIDARFSINESKLSVSKYLKVDVKNVMFSHSASFSIYFSIRSSVKRNMRNVACFSTDHLSCIKGIKEVADIYNVSSFIFDMINEKGCVDPEALKSAIEENGIGTLCLCAVNGETGNIINFDDIYAVAKDLNCELIVDAVAALGKTDVVDICSISDYFIVASYKMGGIIGAAACVTKSIENAQEYLDTTKNISGTLNCPAIMIFGEIISKLNTAEIKKAELLREYFEDTLEKELKDIGFEIEINGRYGKRASSISNIHFPECPAQEMLIMLDMEGLVASSGSACASSYSQSSYVLSGMGYDSYRASQSIRFSLPLGIRKSELLASVKIIQKICRKMVK